MLQEISKSERPDSSGKIPVKWWQWLLMYPTLFVAVMASLPTISTLLASIAKGIPFDSVPIAEEQHRLMEKNQDCLRTANFSHTILENDITVETAVCPSRDIVVHVRAPHLGIERYRWVGFTTFQQSANSTVQQAIATSLNMPLRNKAVPSKINEESIKKTRVICQKLEGDLLLRRIRDANGQCFDEKINTYTGAVNRKPVSCNTKC